jgi:hypothetical protein
VAVVGQGASATARRPDPALSKARGNRAAARSALGLPVAVLAADPVADPAVEGPVVVRAVARAADPVVALADSLAVAADRVARVVVAPVVAADFSARLAIRKCRSAHFM